MQREVLHGFREVPRGVREGNEAEELESRLNDDSRWSIASRKIDWGKLPASLDHVVFNTSVQHFTGQDRLPELYRQFKVYRDHGLLEIARPAVEAGANGTGDRKWLGKYLLAKYYGDMNAAREVVRHRISPNRLNEIRAILIPNEPVRWVFVRNDDGRRTNRLPEAYAELLAERFGGEVENGIAKVSDERNTSAGMRVRAAREFQFAGEPTAGGQCVIVDDVWTTGSTAVALLEYLTGKGVKVSGITTMAIASHGASIRPTADQLAKAYAKAGVKTAEEGVKIAGVDLRRATGSEIHAYMSGAGKGRHGFIDWFDLSANGLALDFGSKGTDAVGVLPSLFGETAEASPSQGELDFGSGGAREVEAAARWSFGARLADGDAAAERALVNYIAYHKLTGGAIPRAATISRLGLALGMRAVSARRIIADAERVAERAVGTVVEKAARNGDVGAALSMMERQKEREEEVRAFISGGAKAGGDLVLGGVVAQGTLLGKRIEQTMRTMTAADLADMEGDTGIDLAAEILENDPKAFDEELKPTKGRKLVDGQLADGSEDETTNYQPPTTNSLTDRERWRRDQAKREAAKRVRDFIERAKRRAEENKEKAARRREENRQRVIAGETPVEPGMGDTVGGERHDAPEKSVAGFRNKWEFAAFVREWAWDKYQKTHGTTSLGKSEGNRLFAEFYRKCAVKMLQDMADKLLDPKGARAWANRRIGELEKGIRPDTIERASAEIFAFINKNAIREERGKLIEKFRREIHQFITGAEFEELKQDSTRRLTGWVEEAARYMMKVCQLSGWATNGHASAFEEERNKLLAKIEERREVYDGSGRDEAYMEANDAEFVRARWKLALLERYGGMAQMMPGEIEDLREDAIRYLTEEAVALEERWKDTKEKQDRLRRAIAGGIVGPNGQRYSDVGFFGKLLDDLNGLLRLRLKHLMRFAGKKERADGEAAINEIVTMLGQGEVEYARAVQRDRQELFAALGRIFQDKEGRPNRRAIREYLKRMEEDIPVELSRQLSSQGFAEHMTYGQMLQLLVSVEQKSYAENVRVNGRGGQAELIRNSSAFTAEDAQFIEWLRAFYEEKRGEISEVTQRMVGNKVDSPDPLYCPVKIYRGELARDLHIDAGRWNPIDEVLSRRVTHRRDFDESATVLGEFYDRSNRMAGLIAWAERGTVIQNVICSGAVQQQINLAFGGGESAKIRRQLEDTFNGGTSRSKTPGEIVAMDKAMNFITFGYLGFNPLSAAKQTTSFTVWANVLPGGFRELWHHMTHIDRKAVRHIMESDEYKVRYGDDTGSGQDFATKALNENVGMNPFMRLMTGPGMWLLKKGDFLPGVWIMQGVYKSLLNKHLNEGMEETAADRLAITEAFNLLEETQQSGRTYNTSALAREHGRLGSALVQFATSALQQLQYETQAFREWRDLKRYGADEERIAEARSKLVRAAFINHVLLPAAMELVIAVFRSIMGEEPKWERDGFAWDLLRDVLLGQASRIFYVGVLASSMMDALFKRQLPRGSQLIPSEGAITLAANVAVTAYDIVTLDGDRIRKDLERLAKSMAPTRIPYNLYRRVTGDSDVDRKRKEAKRK